MYFSSDGPTARSFLDSLRPICETIFNILLITYTASLKAHHDMAESKPKEPGDRTAFGWYLALKFADEALRFSKDAESMSRNESIPRADIRTEQTFSKVQSVRNQFSLRADPLRSC